jgi:transcriptional regulator with XRE-family HTH domain
MGQRRLATRCGVAPSTISRVVRGETSPSYRLAALVTAALSANLGVALDVRDVFSTDGTYPTACVCDLIASCTGCFPPEAYDEDGAMRPEFRDLRPSDWCRFPKSPDPTHQPSITFPS